MMSLFIVASAALVGTISAVLLVFACRANAEHCRQMWAERKERQRLQLEVRVLRGAVQRLEKQLGRRDRIAWQYDQERPTRPGR